VPAPGAARPAAEHKPMPSRAGDAAARGECCNPATPPWYASKLRDYRGQHQAVCKSAWIRGKRLGRCRRDF
jgi:hypothetical protein